MRRLVRHSSVVSAHCERHHVSDEAVPEAVAEVFASAELAADEWQRGHAHPAHRRGEELVVRLGPRLRGVAHKRRGRQCGGVRAACNIERRGRAVAVAMRARVDAGAQQRAALRARERVEVVQRRRVTARRLKPRGGGGVPARAQRVARAPDVGAAAALTRDDLRGATAATTTATTAALGGAHPQPRIRFSLRSRNPGSAQNRIRTPDPGPDPDFEARYKPSVPVRNRFVNFLAL